MAGPQGLRARARADEGRRFGARRDGVRRFAEAERRVVCIFLFLTRPDVRRGGGRRALEA